MGSAASILRSKKAGHRYHTGPGHGARAPSDVTVMTKDAAAESCRKEESDSSHGRTYQGGLALKAGDTAARQAASPQPAELVELREADEVEDFSTSTSPESGRHRSSTVISAVNASSWRPLPSKPRGGRLIFENDASRTPRLCAREGRCLVRLPHLHRSVFSVPIHERRHLTRTRTLHAVPPSPATASGRSAPHRRY
jgi:hypothetical protein